LKLLTYLFCPDEEEDPEVLEARVRERDGMGWPVVIAAAAKLVDQAGGAIVTSQFGWFVPNGNEVRCVLVPSHESGCG
jgi:hypothetical protein